jgi:regulator of cell morphogenesis and NO signaling
MTEGCGCGCEHGAAGRERRGSGTALAVTPDETVGAIGARAPEALAILRRFGIDTCCGGSLTVAQAAASAGVPVATILRALEREEGSA